MMKTKAIQNVRYKREIIIPKYDKNLNPLLDWFEK